MQKTRDNCFQDKQILKKMVAKMKEIHVYELKKKKNPRILFAFKIDQSENVWF